MKKYNEERRVFVVKTHYKNGESFAAMVRKLCLILGHFRALNESTVCKLVEKFEETAQKAWTPSMSLKWSKYCSCTRFYYMVSQKSYLHRARELLVFSITMQKISTKYLHPYKSKLPRELKPADRQMHFLILLLPFAVESYFLGPGIVRLNQTHIDGLPLRFKAF